MVKRWCVVCLLSWVALAGCEQRRTLDDSATPAGGGQQAADGAKRFGFGEQAQRVTQGEQAQVALVVLPQGDLKINPDYPWKAVVEPNAALGISAPITLKRDSFTFSEAEARLPIAVNAGEPGEHKLEASVWLSVCEKHDSQRCLWFEEEPVTLAVTVAPKAGADAAPARVEQPEPKLEGGAQ